MEHLATLEEGDLVVSKRRGSFKLLRSEGALVENGIPFTSFACEDVHAKYDRLKSLGVEFTQPPMEAGPVTIALFHDTCGNLIQIAQMSE